jgi:hypothetical protein
MRVRNPAASGDLIIIPEEASDGQGRAGTGFTGGPDMALWLRKNKERAMLGRLIGAWLDNRHEKRMRKLTARIDALDAEVKASPRLTELFNRAVLEARAAAPVIDRCRAALTVEDMSIMMAGISEYPDVARTQILGHVLLHKDRGGTTEGGLNRFIDRAVAARKPCCGCP